MAPASDMMFVLFVRVSRTWWSQLPEPSVLGAQLRLRRTRSEDGQRWCGGSLCLWRTATAQQPGSSRLLEVNRTCWSCSGVHPFSSQTGLLLLLLLLLL